MNTITSPKLADFKSAGYVVEIEHNRKYRIAYIDETSGKIVIKVMTGKPPVFTKNWKPVLIETLPKGGVTEVWVTDPKTSAEFYGFARCHDNENYNKKTGINKALERVTGLMLVIDGKDGFKMNVKT